MLRSHILRKGNFFPPHSTPAVIARSESPSDEAIPSTAQRKRAPHKIASFPNHPRGLPRRPFGAPRNDSSKRQAQEDALRKRGVCPRKRAKGRRQLRLPLGVKSA